MPLGEFQLIDRFFKGGGAARTDVRLPIGDDAAVLECPPGRQLVAAIDTVVEGVHFPPGSPPASIGHRVLAVNLSDLAAMGAEPAWALLALTLPRAEERWLAEFSRGFNALAREFGVALVGGDTTAGPLCITVQILGFIEPQTALTRAGGTPGDQLFVSGTPGDAAAGLLLGQGKLAIADATIAAQLSARFYFPSPRVALGRRLRSLASACIDVSDGLLGDAGKLAAASGCGADLELTELPLSNGLVQALGEGRARELALTGGDDYELCFSVPASRVPLLTEQLPPQQWGYRRIGALRPGSGERVLRAGTVMDFSHSGFDHFAHRT
ncbi:MAG TPA: thiamine-phosphate kinase [Steroidobacteraceae bacterium]|nr:thiamine-phosphate kinase [Steroidobacteraceae bacterium]